MRRKKDLAGQKFGRLTALEPTQLRDPKGYIVWRCRCDCGKEYMASCNELQHSNLQSCGCRRDEHREKLHTYLTHVDGTSLNLLESRKTPRDNTSGHRGVYFIRGKYVAKIVFQKKAYYLGSYDRMEDAVKARQRGEELLFNGTAEYYRKWQEKAGQDPDWAQTHPVRIHVSSGPDELHVTYDPAL